MLINRIQFDEHPLFGNQAVDFGGGRLFVLCGKNGVGKTTFLESLGFQLRPSIYGVNVRKPFSESDLNFKKQTYEPALIFSHNIEFNLVKSDFSLLQEQLKSRVGIGKLDQYDFFPQFEFIEKNYKLSYENSNKPKGHTIESVPLAKDISNDSLIFINDRMVDDFFFCVNGSSEILSSMPDWNKWAGENFIPLYNVSKKIFYLNLTAISSLLLPVITFLDKFKRAFEEVYPQLMENSFPKGEHFNISGLQDAIQRELSMGQNRFLFTLIEIEKFNASNCSFIVFEEPEQNFDPVGQKNVIAIYRQFVRSSAQIFLTTHSPYLLSYFSSKLNEESEMRILTFNREENEKVKISVCATGSQATQALPHVFGIYAEDIFIRLYSQMLCDLSSLEKGRLSIRLTGLLKNKIPDIETRLDPHDGDVALPIYLRNAIHHPENTNRSYTDDDLKKSINYLMTFLNVPH